MANKITISDCENKLDEAISVVRNNVDVVKQGKLFEECILFLKVAVVELTRLKKYFDSKQAKQFITALDNMIVDVATYGVKVSA